MLIRFICQDDRDLLAGKSVNFAGFLLARANRVFSVS